MPSLTIRNLDDKLKARLRLRAARHARSMEEEARVILRAALTGGPEAPEPSLAEAMQALFAPLGGADLALPSRTAVREPPEFE